MPFNKHKNLAQFSKAFNESNKNNLTYYKINIIPNYNLDYEKIAKENKTDKVKENQIMDFNTIDSMPYRPNASYNVGINNQQYANGSHYAIIQGMILGSAFI